MNARPVLNGLSLLLLLIVAAPAVHSTEAFRLLARNRVANPNADGEYRVVEKELRWDPRKTAVVVCDMWDQHWCRGATERVAAMAPTVDAFLSNARDRGALIFHCPSGTLEAYAETPQRARAQSAPPADSRIPFKNWCHLDPENEAPLPIDDSDGGCDDDPPCKQAHPWTRQIDTITIAPEDAISESAEVFHLMEARGIQHVMVLGVHLNMCVLGRPFGIRQLVQQGKEVVLVRDLTDTMYNSRQRPGVNHFTGTDLMVEHVEKYWCPTITSADLLDRPSYRFPKDTRPRAVLMIGEDEYRTWISVPEFGQKELLPAGYAITVVHELAGDRGVFPTLETVLPEAELLLVSVRRRALPPDQMQAIHKHLERGRPVVAIRTSSHAFAPRGDLAEAVERGERRDWIDFDPEVLGGNYHGHHGSGPLTTVSPAAGAVGRAILQGIDTTNWQSPASLYRVIPLTDTTEPLLYGTIPGQPQEPVAWTHRYGPHQARVFYTSLGHVDDFDNPQFRRLLLNAIQWCLESPSRP